MAGSPAAVTRPQWQLPNGKAGAFLLAQAVPISKRSQRRRQDGGHRADLSGLKLPVAEDQFPVDFEVASKTRNIFQQKHFRKPYDFIGNFGDD
jgi:hypothetical protein